MAIIPYLNNAPKINEQHFIAPDAWVIGEVTIAPLVSIFFGAVLRGDINPIYVGKGSNIQENAMLHTSQGLGPCTVGENVTIGHHAIIHGCTIADNCIIGMGSVILDGAKIGKNCIIGAQALVPMNAVIPDGSLVVGVPAKVLRPISEEQRQSIIDSALSYQKTGANYRKTLG
jgi:carbonic anhydrase/acetyltransferase-like protein (isoleucine patch superfamily)